MSTSADLKPHHWGFVELPCKLFCEDQAIEGEVAQHMWSAPLLFPIYKPLGLTHSSTQVGHADDLWIRHDILRLICIHILFIRTILCTADFASWTHVSVQNTICSLEANESSVTHCAAVPGVGL